MYSLPEHIAELIRKGQKLEAIKLLREETGVSLEEAKEAVDHMDADPAFDPIGATNQLSGVSDEVQQMAWEGREIEAIKLLREESGLGLKEAKRVVEQLRTDPTLPQGMKASPVIAVIVALAVLAIGMALAIVLAAG